MICGQMRWICFVVLLLQRADRVRAKQASIWRAPGLRSRTSAPKLPEPTPNGPLHPQLPFKRRGAEEWLGGAGDDTWWDQYDNFVVLIDEGVCEPAPTKKDAMK